MATPPTSAGDYLSSTRNVLQAADRLRTSLNDDIATREFAVSQLEQAVKRYDAQGESTRAFMFSEPATEEDRATAVPPEEFLLQSIEIDLGIANVLIAAGATLGETGTTAPPRLLDEAVLRLETTTQGFERAESSQAGRFGFSAAVSAAPEAAASPDLPTAIANFRRQADETLTALVSDAQSVVGAIVDELSKTKGDQLLSALSRLNTGVSDLPKVGRLIRQGIEKVEQAIDALIRFLGSEALERAKEVIAQFVKDVQDGKHVANLLGHAFGIEATRAYVVSIVDTGGLTLEALDRSASALEQLSARFKAEMETARGIVSIVSIGGAALALIPAIGAQAVLIALLLNALVMAWVLALGADYADHGDLLRRVHGVRKLAESARAA